MKKIISVFIGLAIIFSLGGCEIPNPFAQKTIQEGNKVPEQKPEEKVKKIEHKVLSCNGVLEEDGFSMKEEININFTDDKATDIVFAFIYDFDVTEEELNTLYESFDFQGEIEKLFKDEFGIENNLFTIKVDKLETNEVKVEVAGDYLDLVKAFANDGTTEKDYDDTSYDNVYDIIIKEEVENNNLTCSTKEV